MHSPCNLHMHFFDGLIKLFEIMFQRIRDITIAIMSKDLI